MKKNLIIDEDNLSSMSHKKTKISGRKLHHVRRGYKFEDRLIERCFRINERAHRRERSFFTKSVRNMLKQIVREELLMALKEEGPYEK